jgi:glutathione S-transferase
MEELKIYIDYLSQPSRAVLAFCLANEIPHTVVETKIMQNGVATDSFKKVSPMRVVPAISIGEFALFESQAILVYLARRYRTPDHWFPKDPQLQARVNAYLHWHHLNLRYGCGYYLFNAVILPMLGSKKKISEEQAQEFDAIRKRSLRFIEERLNSGKFVAETEEVSIADVSCFCELEQMRIAAFDYSPYPNIERWRKRMRNVKGISEAHRELDKMLGEPKL